MRAVWAALLIGGCFQPHPIGGAPCGDNSVCPSELVCRQGLCVSPGALDAEIDTRIDGPKVFDAPPSDAFANDIGCADGTREAFVDRVMYPTLAGCAASWDNARDLRAAKTGATCGGAVKCIQPADACAAGWHLCANTGNPVDITARISAAACLSAGGATGSRYVGATSHCTSAGPCVYTTPYGCLASGTCSEPVCCGSLCINTQGCRAGVFPDPDTAIAGDTLNGCGALLASAVSGVMCCHD